MPRYHASDLDVYDASLFLFFRGIFLIVGVITVNIIFGVFFVWVPILLVVTIPGAIAATHDIYLCVRYWHGPRLAKPKPPPIYVGPPPEITYAPHPVETPIEDLEKDIAQQSVNPSAWLLLGKKRRASGNLLGAASALKEAVRLAPRFPTAWFALSEVLKDLGDLKGAAEAEQRGKNSEN